MKENERKVKELCKMAIIRINIIEKCEKEIREINQELITTIEQDKKK